MSHDLDQLHAKIVALFNEWYPDMNKGGACLYWMQVTMRVIRDHGIPVLPMAGSASFRMNDGDDDNYYQFKWDPTGPASQRAISLDQLPEIHCWAVTPVFGILDCSTPWIKELALSHGHNWTLPSLPPYISGSPVGDGHLYEPNWDATAFAVKILQRGVSGKTGLPRLSAWASQ